MYKSPVEVIYGQLQTKFEGDVVKAVQSYNINVDRDELIKALAYDRDQYEAGCRDAMATIVRCKDCVYYKTVADIITGKQIMMCDYGLFTHHVPAEHYCGYGVRKDGAE